MATVCLRFIQAGPGETLPGRGFRGQRPLIVSPLSGRLVQRILTLQLIITAQEFAAANPGVSTVDLNPFFHDENGELRDIFVEDGLHLTDSGYEEMAAWLTPKVKALLG